MLFSFSEACWFYFATHFNLLPSDVLPVTLATRWLREDAVGPATATATATTVTPIPEVRLEPSNALIHI